VTLHHNSNPGRLVVVDEGGEIVWLDMYIDAPVVGVPWTRARIAVTREELRRLAAQLLIAGNRRPSPPQI
jgi:hypothetical protein